MLVDGNQFIYYCPIKKRLSTHSEAKLLNFLVLSALSAFSRALTAAAASSMT
jgi:hypothetical protein